jgi:nuclear pore complex protein Nup133
MTYEGFEELMVEEELGGIIRVFIRETIASASSNSSDLDLELLDVVVDRQVSFTRRRINILIYG